MAEEYLRRYNRPFQTMPNCDSFERFALAATERLTSQGTFCLLYTGSLYLERWRSLLDIARAVARLREQGLAGEIHVFTSRLEPEVAAAFAVHPAIIVHDMAADSRVPGRLKAADVLLLPEGFSKRVAKHIRLSISSKAHLYMMSQRPTLVYGPAVAGTVRYAREWGWAEVVDHAGDVAAIATTIRRLLTHTDDVTALTSRALACARRNHDATVVRPRFEELLTACARTHSPVDV